MLFTDHERIARSIRDVSYPAHTEHVVRVHYRENAVGRYSARIASACRVVRGHPVTVLPVVMGLSEIGPRRLDRKRW